MRDKSVEVFAVGVAGDDKGWSDRSRLVCSGDNDENTNGSGALVDCN